MPDQFIFEFNPALPPHCVLRAQSFMQELDDFAARLQPSGSRRLLGPHAQSLFHGGADAERGYEVLEQMQQRLSAPGFSMTAGDAQNLFACIILLALHLAVHALQAASQEESSDYLADARYLRGYADGLIWTGDDALVISEMGRRGAKVSNSIFEPSRKRIFDWCDENFNETQSVESATQEAMQIGGVSYVTAKKHINAWRKERGLVKKPIKRR